MAGPTMASREPQHRDGTKKSLLKIKPTVSYPFTPVRVTVIKKKINAGKGVEKRNPLFTLGGNIN